MRVLYIIGWGYIAIASALIYRAAHPPRLAEPGQLEMPDPQVAPLGTAPMPPAPVAESWFERVRAHCNPVEVEVTLSSNPAPADWQNQSYAAACYALAGKIQRAIERIEALSAEQQQSAANIVFNVVHPVADAGDDEAAGPMMELVLRYTPDNYMALYHAGIAQYRTGEPDLARKNLKRFLELYNQNDGWTSSAQETLRALGRKEQS
ncbi:MAG: hypothetical protein ACRERX_14450 [Pseudomonas sp.]